MSNQSNFVKASGLVYIRGAMDEMHLALNTWTLFFAALRSKQKKYIIDEAAASCINQ